MPTPYDTVEPTKPDQKPIRFKRGGLHESTGTPAGKKIPAAKKLAALKGKFGSLAKKRAQFAKNVLVGRKGK